MPLASGLAAQIGVAAESTWGTAVTVTRFFPLVDESLTQQIDRLESAGIIAGARVLRSQQWQPGGIMVEGDVGLELYDRSIGLLFTHMFGGVVTAGAGPFTHTFTPGDLAGKGLTVQVGRPDVAGVVQPFTYAGCKVGSWEIGFAADEYATLGLTLVGKTETTATGLAVASYAAGIKPFRYIDGALTIAGGSQKVKGGSLAGDNGLDTDRKFLGQNTIDEPLEAARRAYTGTLDIEFSGLTQYNRFVNGTEAALVLTFTAGAQILTVTANVRFDGETPNIGGTGIVTHAVPFKAVGASTDAGAITAVLTTSEPTP